MTKLMETVQEFTEGLLGKDTRENMCYTTCIALQAYLDFDGFGKYELTEGSIYCDRENMLFQHFWLTAIDGTIVDPTASQFSKCGRTLPDVYIGAKPIWYLPVRADE